jgi:hypothetical protein
LPVVDAGSKPDAATPTDSGVGTTDSGSTSVDSSTQGRPLGTRQCNSVSSVHEQYSLPAPTSIPSGTSFLSDWANRPIAGGFNGVQAMDTCRYRLDASFRTWHDKPAVRVEVNAGDDALNSGGERSEVLTMQTSGGGTIEESSSSGRTFIATSYYFPSNWDGTFIHGDGESWSAVMQFHPSGSAGYFAGLHAGRRDVGMPQKFYWSSGALSEFSDGSAILLGQWVDLVMQFDFATGDFRIYRRNEGQSKFVQVLAITDSSMVTSNTTYFKQGLYRGPDVNGRTDVLWIGPTARATTFAAAELASFGTANGF